MDFDVILDEIGEFGKFQLTNYILICLPVLYAAANSLTYIFVARSPNYRCFVQQCDSQQSPKYNEEWIKDVLPGSISENTRTFVPETCFQYKSIDNITFVNASCPAHIFDHERVKCNKWVFEEGERTIVNDWPDDLTCAENEWKLALMGSVHYAGIIVGTAAFGFVADSFGRRSAFIFAIVFMAITGVFQALSGSYLLFQFFVFLNALGTSGVYPLAFILGVEMVGKGKREMAGVVLNYFYSLGEALVGVIAWLDGDWVNLQYWVSAPPILFVAYYWIIPESARWLLAKNLNLEALEVVKKVAKHNGVAVSERIEFQFRENSVEDEKEPKSDNEKGEKATYMGVIKSRILLTRCLILFFIWGTNSFVFYGLSLNSVNLSGNIYLNFILGCLIEIPGNTIAWLVINKFGRRNSMSISYLACGITCLIGGFSSDNAFFQVVLFLTGKMAITCSFTILFVYTAEMLPTLIRSGGVGTFSTMARVFTLVAPFVPLLKKYNSFLPLLVFGFFAITSGFLSLLLPETHNINLPNSIQEAENIGRKRSNLVANEEQTHL